MNERLLSTFLDFVKIDSESGREEEFLVFLRKSLEEDFLAECRRDAFGNLIARLPAVNSDVRVPVLFGAHADTVKPGIGIKPVIENGIVRSSGDTVLGADDKAGIAEFVEALRVARRRPPVEFVVTREEEQGLRGAKHLDYSAIESKYGFVLDLDELNVVVVGGPSRMLLEIEVRGRAAHAAMEPECGVSAIRVASRAIAGLDEGRIDDETTVNVGVIEGGTAVNVVPERVRVSMECRSLEHSRCLKRSKLCEQVFLSVARYMGAEARVNSELAYRAWRVSEKSELVKLARRALEGAGLQPDLRTVLGGTDTAIYNEHGIETLVLGTGVRREHSTDEHISIGDMETATSVFARLLEELGKADVLLGGTQG